MNEQQAKGTLLGMILGALLMWFVSGLGDAASLKNKLIDKTAPLPSVPPMVQATRVGPVQAIWAAFGKQTHVWIVAPASGKTLELDVTETEIAVPNQRKIGEAP